MKRILHVVGKMNIGGAEMLLMNVYRNIDREKFQFDFLTFYKPGERGYFDEEISRLGGRIINVPKPSPLRLFRNIQSIRTVIEQEHYDVIHVHIGDNGAYALMAAAREGIPIRIDHAHNVRTDRKSKALSLYYAHLNRLCNKNLTGCAACSQSAAESHFSATNLTKCTIIPNAEDFSPFFQTYDRNRIREAFGINPDMLVLLQVGNIKALKNQLFTVLLADRYFKQEKDVCFLFAGNANGEYGDQIKREIDRRGLGEKVFLLGTRTDIPALMAASDLMLMPSVREGLGMALLEAQASGLPCAVSEAIPPEAIVDSELVRACSVERMDAWKEAIDSLRLMPRKSAEERRMIIGNSVYNLQETVSRFELLYGEQKK